MKYLCLICAEKVMEQMSKADVDKHYEEYRELTADIRKSGHFVDCYRLLPPSAAITIRVRKGKISSTDGPFIETKEQLGGFLLLDVPDLNDAIRIASQFPAARIGSVEVRPMKEQGCA